MVLSYNLANKYYIHPIKKLYSKNYILLIIYNKAIWLFNQNKQMYSMSSELFFYCQKRPFSQHFPEFLYFDWTEKDHDALHQTDQYSFASQYCHLLGFFFCCPVYCHVKHRRVHFSGIKTTLGVPFLLPVSNATITYNI